MPLLEDAIKACPISLLSHLQSPQRDAGPHSRSAALRYMPNSKEGCTELRANQLCCCLTSASVALAYSKVSVQWIRWNALSCIQAFTKIDLVDHAFYSTFSTSYRWICLCSILNTKR